MNYRYGNRLSGILAALIVVTLCSASAKPIPFVADHRSDFLIVAGTNTVYDRFAVNEFKSILEKSTGVALPSAPSGSPEAATAKKRILIGDSPEVRRALGDAVVSGLKPLESLVTGHGDDIIIVGGGNHGTPYGVYAFLEKEVGYRCFTPYPGGERIPKHETLTFSGQTYRERPAFELMRTAYMLYLYDKTAPMYVYRNRGDLRYTCVSGDATLESIEHADLPLLDSGHGFNLYITTERTIKYYEWDEPKDYFQSNPDFFSLDANSNRTTRLQLCFSNPALRKELTRRLIERGRRMGGRGILTLGANDWPGPLCFCPGCKALEAKYGCRGGPLYDYVREACPEVAKALPKIRISTLAYRKAQTEIPPTGVDRMPDNWICDFAPVDDDQGQALDGERNLDTLKNLKAWSQIAGQITYWYYICINSAPFGPVERLSRDMKLMHANGVRGVGVCGVGSPGLYPMQEYILLRLMIDPEQDVWKLVAEFNEHHYGDAAPEMTDYVKELDDVWREPKRFIELSVPGSDILSFTPERLVRWQRRFDSLETRLAGQTNELKNLSLARWDVDLLTLTHYPRIIEAMPDAGDDPERIIGRMRKVELRSAWRFQKLMEHAEIAYLTTKALSKPLPAPLVDLPDGQVTQLPQAGGQYPVKDPDAACGEAKTQPFRDGQIEKQGRKVAFDFYDKASKRTLKHGEIDVSKCVPGQYELYFVTKTTIPRGGFLAFDSWWGISESFAPYYPEGDEFREFEIWASLKFVGPSFGIATEDKKDRMFCDRLFLVDKQTVQGQPKPGDAQ